MPRDHQGQATKPTKSAIDQIAGHRSAQEPSWLAALTAGGRACQHRPARSLHPGRGTELHPHVVVGLLGRGGRNQMEVWVGSIVWSTTVSRWADSASRSTSLRRWALKASMVMAAS
jgi:hypothetical protein